MSCSGSINRQQQQHDEHPVRAAATLPHIPFFTCNQAMSKLTILLIFKGGTGLIKFNLYIKINKKGIKWDT